VLIGQDLCRALSAVHRAGYIHRDVKAKNVMRDDAGRIVLMDFGTGRTTEAQQGKSDRAGTPLYMAPEVLEGGQASATSDVYSLGVLLYHLVTADYPVRAESVDELRDAHANRRHRWLSELRPDLPVAFMQVVEKAIALEPDDRYSNASELLAALSGLRLGVHPWMWRVAKPLIVLGGIAVGMLVIGAITSAHFNVALQRSGFSNDSVWDWLAWGRLSSFMPFAVLVVAGLAGALLSVLRRLLISVSSTVRRLDVEVGRRARDTAHRLRLDEAPVAAGCALLLSAGVLATAWWYFTPLLLALVSYASTAPESSLRLLTPDFVDYHNLFRQVFSGVALIAVAVWYPVVRLVRRGQSLHWGLWVAGALVVSLSLACLHFSYRLLVYRNYVDLVQWRGSECGVIGERGTQLLLLCPDVQTPRNRTVSRDDQGLVFLGTQERLTGLIARVRAR
jgi:hypothetical protein